MDLLERHTQFIHRDVTERVPCQIQFLYPCEILFFKLWENGMEPIVGQVVIGQVKFILE